MTCLPFPGKVGIRCCESRTKYRLMWMSLTVEIDWIWYLGCDARIESDPAPESPDDGRSQAGTCWMILRLSPPSDASSLLSIKSLLTKQSPINSADWLVGTVPCARDRPGEVLVLGLGLISDSWNNYGAAEFRIHVQHKWSTGLFNWYFGSLKR